MTTTAADRRDGTDRRIRRASFHYPERRSGFDRRTLRSSAWGRLLDGYRNRPVVIGACLALIAVLGAADLILTHRLLEAGATEINPVMARLLDSGVGGAVLLKAGVTAAVVGAIWALRRYRRILEFSLIVLAGMLALVAYQVIGLAATG